MRSDADVVIGRCWDVVFVGVTSRFEVTLAVCYRNCMVNVDHIIL